MGALSKFVGASVGAVSLLLLTFMVRKSVKGKGYRPPVKGLWWRPASKAIECSLFQFSQKSAWNIAYVQRIISKEPVTVDQIHTALLQVASYHPLLRSKMIKYKDLLIFQEIQDFDINVYESDDTDWLPLFEKYLLDNYSDGSPLWKVGFLKNIPFKYTDDRFPYECTLLFGFNHAIMDGTREVQLMREVLMCLEPNLSGNSNPALNLNSALIPTEDLPMEITVPGMKKTLFDIISGYILRILIKFPYVINFLESHMANLVRPNQWVEKFGSERERNHSADVKTTMLPKVLTEKETSRLVAACKSHGVTVHSALQTATCIAVAKLLQDGTITESQQLTFAATFSMRRFITEQFSRNMIGCYFDGYPGSTTVEPNWSSQFWEYVKQEQIKMKDHIEHICSSGKSMTRIMYMSEPFRGTKLDFMNLPKEGKRFDSVFSITNVGLCDFVNKDLDCVQLAARYSSSGEHVIGPIFANSLSTVRGRLFWGLIYYPHIISKETAECIWNTIIEVLGDTVLV